MKDSDLIYIAGFFDGEGCISGKTPREYCPTVKISITQRRTEILYWIKETLEMGRVYTYCTSHWVITNKKDVGKFINLILPYSKVKREELIVGQRLNSLIGEAGHECTVDNRQKRMKLYNLLKLLKRK